MNEGRTIWYLDEDVWPLCRHAKQPVHTDGRKKYVYCPTCDEKWVVGYLGSQSSANTGQSKEAKLSDKDYEENLLQHGVIR